MDLKVVFFVLVVFCQLYYVQGWWGGGSRSPSGGRSRSTGVRTTSTRRGRLWSGRSSRSNHERKPSIRKPSFRKPSISRRGRWWSRRTPVARKPTPIRKPAARRSGWFWRRKTPTDRRKPAPVPPPKTGVQPPKTGVQPPKTGVQNVNKLLKGKSMEQIIAEFEGSRLKVYEDTNGIKTVGVGFNLDQGDAKKEFEKHIPKSEVSFDDIRSGKKSLTEDQSIRLFKGNVEWKETTTKRLFPNYDTFPKAVKTALVNGVFRGEFDSSQEVVKLINEGKWEDVADEYLNRRDYRNSKPGKNGGIKTRMDYNAEIFRGYAKDLKKG